MYVPEGSISAKVFISDIVVYNASVVKLFDIDIVAIVGDERKSSLRSAHFFPYHELSAYIYASTTPFVVCTIFTN